MAAVTRAERHELSAEVGLAYLGIGQQLFTAALHDDMSMLHHIAPVGQLQRLVGILLDQEDGHALAAQLLNDLEDLLDDDWRQAQ